MVIDIAFEMMRELNGVKYIYSTTLTDCFHAVCKKYGLDPKEQNQEDAVQKVQAALRVTY
ncbi:hypothetical protein EHV15_34120 [Paenibacillus oralis]|uniref:Uncharacterized protein n=1 Tax=Paenibacillus oralis TaxID=2490856 RepID=A0A3P3T9B4_9BACL|nr:hypothetical protein [Paenibacillus oralis]RRJ54635.1 hypothetical protein EHV15_34120 [Paenibacillus oralis]